MNKKFFLFILAASSVFLTAFFLIPGLKVQTPPPPTKSAANLESAMIVINYGENDTSSDSLEVDEKSTAFSLLNNFAERENIPLETQQYDFGVFVKSVNGKESTPEMAWIYFVNGQSGQIAADQMKIKPGDTVEWKFIKPE